MFSAFEWMVAGRYLRARRAEGFISVIAGFSLLGIALGVGTLIVVLSVMNGFRDELLGRILGLNGHLVVQSVSGPVRGYDDLATRIGALEGVVSAIPIIDGQVMATANNVAGGALVRGLHEAGLSACAKHFPGHGHVETDSHVDLPTCPLDEATLQQNHIAPFAASLEAGVDAVMTAHVLYPEVDAQRPATLSPTWIDGVLRRQLGFDGAVLTDDLGMGAIVKHGGIGAAAVQAIRAGVDGLLVCRHIEAIDEATAALAAEAARDESFRQRCYESLARLEDLARKRPPHPASKDQLHHHLGTPAHRGLAARLAGDTGAPGADPTSDGSHTA